VFRSDAENPSDTMRERVSGSEVKFWLLFGADRWLVTTLLLSVVFVSLVAIGVIHPRPALQLLTRGDPIETLYQALVSSTITGVTVVLTLSQLLLSQELGAVGEQRERMDGALSFRRDVEAVVQTDVSPAEPSAFLRVLVGSTRERATDLLEAIDENAEYADAVESYVDTVTGNADAVTDQLTGSQFGTFDVVEAALNYNYSWKLYAGRRILADHDLPEPARDAMTELLDLLELFGPAREHFKTLYFQWELSNLSRAILYVSIPALVVTIASLLFFDPRGIDGTILGVNQALLIASATITTSLAPFAVLLAYVLRIVTVTKRTLSIGPFILRETERAPDIEWD
jgi:hypothetical protein